MEASKSSSFFVKKIVVPGFAKVAVEIDNECLTVKTRAMPDIER